MLSHSKVLRVILGHLTPTLLHKYRLTNVWNLFVIGYVPIACEQFNLYGTCRKTQQSYWLVLHNINWRLPFLKGRCFFDNEAVIASEKKTVIRSFVNNITNTINGEGNLVQVWKMIGNRQNQNDFHDHASHTLEIILIVIGYKMCCMKAQHVTCDYFCD